MVDGGSPHTQTSRVRKPTAFSFDLTAPGRLPPSRGRTNEGSRLGAIWNRLSATMRRLVLMSGLLRLWVEPGEDERAALQRELAGHERQGRGAGATVGGAG